MGEVKIAYLCDGKACPECKRDSGGTCNYTTQIEHAVNFALIGKQENDILYIEKERNMNEQNTVENKEQTVEETVEKTEVKSDQKKKRMDKDTQRFYSLLHVIFSVCSLSGFRLEGRVQLRDLKTGKLWE